MYSYEKTALNLSYGDLVVDDSVSTKGEGLYNSIFSFYLHIPSAYDMNFVCYFL